MSTLNDKLTRLAGYKTAIKTALTEKGATVTDDMSTWASAIGDISAGGGKSAAEVMIDNMHNLFNSSNTTFHNKTLTCKAVVYQFAPSSYEFNDTIDGVSLINEAGSDGTCTLKYNNVGGTLSAPDQEPIDFVQIWNKFDANGYNVVFYNNSTVTTTKPSSLNVFKGIFMVYRKDGTDMTVVTGGNSCDRAKMFSIIQ